MGLGGVRKLEVELGESAMVMGLGLLGMFSVQFLRLSGANPLIAVDLNPERRELALNLGADYAFDPSAHDFVDQVMALTKGKGVRATVEVTGVSAAMKQAPECAYWMDVYPCSVAPVFLTVQWIITGRCTDRVLS